MKTYYITGISGTGKSTVIEELSKRGYSTIDIDDVEGLCHWVNKSSGELADYYTGVGADWLSQHEWICDKTILKKELLSKKSEIVFVCGLADNKTKILPLFQKVFLLQADEDTITKRLTSSGRAHDFGFHEADRKYIFSIAKDFETQSVKAGAIPINTNQPAAQVINTILSEL